VPHGVNPIFEFSFSARLLQAEQGFTPTKEAAFFTTSPNPISFLIGKGIFTVRFLI
jgi:hypothetical protein